MPGKGNSGGASSDEGCNSDDDFHENRLLKPLPVSLFAIHMHTHTAVGRIVCNGWMFDKMTARAWVRQNIHHRITRHCI